MRGRLHLQVQGSTSSPTGVGSRRRVLRCYGIWNVPVGLSQKEYVRISMKEIGRNLDCPPKGRKRDT